MVISRKTIEKMANFFPSYDLIGYLSELAMAESWVKLF
jgi:hypothetical protein